MKTGWKIALAAFGAGVAAAGATGAVGVMMARGAICRQKDQHPEVSAAPWDEYSKIIARRAQELLDAYPPEHLTITSGDGLTLHAKLFSPPGAEKLAVCVHGYHSTGMNDFGGSMAWYYIERGWRVLLVDDRAHGDSEGEIIGFGTLDREDVLRWLQYAVIRFGEHCPMVLHGLSMGAATVLMATGLPLPENVRAVVGDCGFTSAWDQFSYMLVHDFHLPKFPLMQVADLWAQKFAGYGLRQCDASEELKKATVPVMFIHGEADAFVPEWMTEKNYEACPTMKMKYICPGAGHAESWFRDEQTYCDKLDEFYAAVFAPAE